MTDIARIQQEVNSRIDTEIARMKAQLVRTERHPDTAFVSAFRAKIEYRTVGLMTAQQILDAVVAELSSASPDIV